MSARLSRADLTALEGEQPPHASGLVHLGLGAFHRAHQAVITADAMRVSGDGAWGIRAATQRSSDAADRLIPQDLLYTVHERGAGARTPSLVSAITEVLPAHADPETLVAAIASAETHVVTLTVTERGYHATPDGRLDLEDPDIVADLSGAIPSTAIGRLVRGLERRRAIDAPLTVLSCDNILHNGERLHGAVLAFAERLEAGDDLASWVDRSVRFPSSMVDRIVPAVSARDLDDVERLLGRRDEAAVLAEPFRQWVIEDAFAGPRPRWELAGAELVANVDPWERAKLGILNGVHLLIAYRGLLHGYGTIAEAIRDPDIEASARDYLMTDVIPSLTAPEGVDLTAYAEEVLGRLANPALGHRTAQVGTDGSLKIPIRVLPIVRSARAAGRLPVGAAAVLASWMEAATTTGVPDTHRSTLDALAAPRGADAVSRWLTHPALAADDLADDLAFRDEVAAQLAVFRSRGRRNVKGVPA